MKHIIAIALIALANAAHHNTFIAEFTGNITGNVTIDNGYVMVDLDLSSEPDLPDNFSMCTTGGLKYHIHTKWDHEDNSSRIGSTQCGSSYTGGHWDPWHGCGSASGNAFCSNNGGCINVTDYSAEYDNDAFSAEIGDWNGKYGLISLDNDNKLVRDDSSFFEVTPDDMDVLNMSVVFHCNGGSRAFCAPFVESSTSTSESIPEQNSSATATAVLDQMGSGSMVYFDPSGRIVIHLNGSNFTDTTGCSEFSYGIFENGTSSWNWTTTSLLGSDCDAFVGDFWDPTHQCMDFSGSEYCTGDYLCNDTSYAYDCDFDNDRYSCAPGDISGKMGLIPKANLSSSASFMLYYNDSDTLIPRTDAMVGMMFAVYCGNNSAGLSTLACAPMVDVSSYSTTTTTAETNDTDTDSETTTTTTTTMATTTTTTYSAGNTYAATFGGDNNITGTVTVDNGYVVVDLNLSAMPALNGNYTECVSGGLKYHIHDKWLHSDSSDKIGSTQCGASYTGGHYDPWHACGSASGNEYCSNKGGCINVTDYSADFDNDTFSAEVGDWNGKYGLATVDSDGTIYIVADSYWEVITDDVKNMSVVFHCNDGSRAFCAPFEESSDETSYDVPDQQDSLNTLVAYTDIGDVWINNEVSGSVEIDLDWSELNDTSGCTEYYYGIFEADMSLSTDKYLTDCSDYVGDFWDPTHQCMDFSGSEHCTGDYLCNDTSYGYDCDFNNDRYSCAPGDLSGKYGSATGTSLSVAITSSKYKTYLIPNSVDLEDMLFVVYCGDNSAGITYLMCTSFETVTTTTDSEDIDDSVGALVVGLMSMVATLAAVLF